MKRIAFVALTCLASSAAFATPITYTTLNNNAPVLGEISPSGYVNTTSTAQYYSFYSKGDSVTVRGSRIDGGYDMAFWLFSGLFTNTNAFGSTFDTGDAGYLGFFDDEMHSAAPGPYGDPRFVGVLPVGWYTVAVTNFASNGVTGGDGAYDFQLVARHVRNNRNNVPEPLSVALFGAGLLALGITRRRSA